MIEHAVVGAQRIANRVRHLVVRHLPLQHLKADCAGHIVPYVWRKTARQQRDNLLVDPIGVNSDSIFTGEFAPVQLVVLAQPRGVPLLVVSVLGVPDVPVFGSVLGLPRVLPAPPFSVGFGVLPELIPIPLLA